jgi:hypothetical protein
MKTNYRMLLGLVLVLSAGVARPQEGDAAAKVTADAVDPVTVRIGHSVPVQFTFHVKQGFHINSHQPSAPELIPTQLMFYLPEDLVMAKMEYPAGKLTSFPFDPNTKLSVYSGDVVIRGIALASSKSAAGRYTVHAELKYQACDNNACYPPKKLPLAFDVKITEGATTSRRARPNAQSPHIHN